MIAYHPPKATFVVRVGSGTYVRSLCHDLGRRLGCGAYLSALRRTKIGSFSDDQAVGLDSLEAQPQQLRGRLLPIGDALVHMPKLTLLPAQAARLRHGAPFDVHAILEFEGRLETDGQYLVLSESGRPIAVVKAVLGVTQGGSDLPPLVFKPMRVLQSADQGEDKG
jgi:tRNA pseudouridine55 synthase